MRVTGYMLATGLVLALMGADAPGGKPAIIAKPDAFKTLVNPNCSHCKDEAARRAKDLREDDRVLCWIRGKYQGGAIPYRFYLAPYRVISDTYGVFVYDADAGYVRGFEPSLDFTFHGWRNGVMVIKHKDGTLFSALTGQAIDGPRKGDRLKPVPTLESDWGHWLKLYPDTVAYHMYDKYQAVELKREPQADSVRSRSKNDPRLSAESPVLGVRIGEHARAYPLSVLEKAGVINDELAGLKLSVFWDPSTRTAVAYLNGGKPFTIDRKTPSAPFVRQGEEATHYDITGRPQGSKAEGGLEWVDGVQVKWFAWAAEYPSTQVYGQSP